MCALPPPAVAPTPRLRRRPQVGQPFDIIKTRLQVLAKGSSAAAGLPEYMVYSNSMDCVRKMVRCAPPSPACSCAAV
jgi:hypothetical protein